MRIMSSTAFLAFNTVLGLVVNVLTLGGFVFGVIELKPGWGLLSKPYPVITLLYVFMAVVWLLVALTFLSMMKRRRVGQPVKTDAKWQNSFEVLLYAVTLPTTILWATAALELLEPIQVREKEFGPVFFAGVTLLFGGTIVAHAARAIDWFFNPTHYEDEPPQS